jgi:zinc protease
MMFQGSKHVETTRTSSCSRGAGASGVNGTTTSIAPTTSRRCRRTSSSWRSGSSPIAWAICSRRSTRPSCRISRTSSATSAVRAPRTARTAWSKSAVSALFPKGHPYHGVVIGSHDDIQAAKLEDVQQFFRQYYAPNNATIAIAGDIDKAATKKLVEKYFRHAEAWTGGSAREVDTPPIAAEKRMVVEDRIELPRIYMAWLTPPFFKDGDADADIVGGVLGQGRSSRLYKKLVYEKQIAQSVTAYQQSMVLGSVFAIEATARPNHTLQELEAAINEELDAMRAKGPTGAEIERVRNVLETQIFSGLQLVGGFGGVADQLNLYNHYLGTPDYLAQGRCASAARDARERAAVRAAVSRHERPRGRAGHARKTGAGARSAQGGRSGRQWRTAGLDQRRGALARETARGVGRARGARARAAVVSVVERADGDSRCHRSAVCPSSRRASWFAAAATRIRIEKPGLASFTAALLDQGTATRTAPQLADEIAQIGASLNTGTSRDASTISTGSLSRNFPAALSLLADVALRPSFPAEEVERVRARRLADLVEQRANPVQIATNVAGRTLYGTHQYGFSETGTVESNKQLTRDDLQAFWRQNFVPGNSATRRHRRRHAGRGAQAGGSVVRELAERYGVAREARHAVDLCAAPGHRRSSGLAADAVARVHIRRAAQQPRLRAGAGHEHDSRRDVLQPHQHESPRGARVHLRRELAVCVLAQRRPVLGQQRRAHRRHRAGRA